MLHENFNTIIRRLHRNTPPMRLFEKAKRFGIWNPSEIDFTQDKHDWACFNDDERDLILRLTALFQAGEEAVTLDLLPLIMIIAREGRLEEELFLTSFLFEEAKHTDFFARFLDEVAGLQGDLSHYHSDNYKSLIYHALPNALNALNTDSSPAAQVRASVTYNMIVEGVLAETGYHAYKTTLERNNLMPGQCRGITLLKQDESRHIAYGIYLISRLVAEDESFWEVAEQTMNELLTPTLSIVTELFTFYNPMPFGLQLDEFATYAMMQYQKRLMRLQSARGASPETVMAITQAAIDADDV